VTDTLAKPAPGGNRARGRDGYFDTLRAVALVRVVVYHTFGWVWLPAVFPSMGIMFALAGALMAASLDRSKGDHWQVLGKRLRRLLPPLWLMGILLVPLMIWHGWTSTDTEGVPLQWNTLLLWVLPISDPPGSSWGNDWVVPLWYIRTYLWFVLLSPAALWLLRRWTKRVLAVPLIAIVLLALGILGSEGRTGAVILDLSTFGACWMLGFAHHDGRIRVLAWRKIAVIGGLLLAAGLSWAVTHQDPVSGWDLDGIPLAQAFYSVGAVLLLLRLHPDFSWLAQRPVLSKLITVANSRAVTIYLWNNVAIFAAAPLIGVSSVTAALDNEGLGGQLLTFAVAWVGIAGAVLALGWVEDLAAGRRPRINPWPRTSPLGLSLAAVDRPAAEAGELAPVLDPAPAVAAPLTVRMTLGTARGPERPRVRTVSRAALVGGLAIALAGGAGVFWFRGASPAELMLPQPAPAPTIQPAAPSMTTASSTSVVAPSATGRIHAAAPQQAPAQVRAVSIASTSRAVSKSTAPIKLTAAGSVAPTPTPTKTSSTSDPTLTSGSLPGTKTTSASTTVTTAPSSTATSSTDPVPSSPSPSTGP
jgi:peptidoglycan/LPS O-acetylase OafA/YrhL